MLISTLDSLSPFELTAFGNRVFFFFFSFSAEKGMASFRAKGKTGMPEVKEQSHYKQQQA